MAKRAKSLAVFSKAESTQGERLFFQIRIAERLIDGDCNLHKVESFGNVLRPLIKMVEK